MDNLKSILLTSTAIIALAPSAAMAGPFIAALGPTFTALGTGLGVVGGVGAAASYAFLPGVVAFGSALGSTLLSVGANLLLQALTKSSSQGIDKVQVNSRLESEPRTMAGGTVAVGGGVGCFAEHDSDGNFWFFVTHADSELTGTPQYILDGVEVDLDVNGWVDTDEFCLTDKYAQYEGTGTKVKYWRIWTVTPDASNVYGARPSEFSNAFPNVPADFYLAGVSYSIVYAKNLPLQHRSTLFKWRGQLGLGEPFVVVVGNFSRMYDPRLDSTAGGSGAHRQDDPDTWTAGDGNPAIVWAWFRTAARGRNRPMSEVDWTEVAAQANICDTTVLDRDDVITPLYKCGVAFKDDRPRHECEAEIRNTCAGFVAYSEDGKSYLDVGYYTAPTLTFTAERDIYTSETKVINDGETSVDGVIVNYISPDHGYTKQSCAPWVNSLYYDGSGEPDYYSADVLGCQNHNQAVRLAKNIGLQIAPARQAAISTTIKGLLVAGKRTISLAMDAQFTGDYEIVSPVRRSPGGESFGFSVVPMQSDRFTLSDGEEGEPPIQTPDLQITNDLDDASNVVITAESVLASSGALVRFKATFDSPTREDRVYKFRYAPTGTTDYRYFSTDMVELVAYSDAVNEGDQFDISWATISGSGRESEYTTAITRTAAATLPPDDLASVTTSVGMGHIVFSFTTPDDPNYRGVRVYRGSGEFDTATEVLSLTDTAPNQSVTVTAGDDSAVNVITNGGFDADSDWTKGANWSIASGKATHATGTFGILSQTFTALEVGEDYRAAFTVYDDDVSDGNKIRFRLLTTAGNLDPMDPDITTATADNVAHRDSSTFTATAGTDEINIRPATNFGGSVDDIYLFQETAAHLPQGESKYWIVPVSFALQEGNESGPYTIHVP